MRKDISSIAITIIILIFLAATIAANAKGAPTTIAPGTTSAPAVGAAPPTTGTISPPVIPAGATATTGAATKTGTGSTTTGAEATTAATTAKEPQKTMSDVTEIASDKATLLAEAKRLKDLKEEKDDTTGTTTIGGDKKLTPAQYAKEIEKAKQKMIDEELQKIYQDIKDKKTTFEDAYPKLVDIISDEMDVDFDSAEAKKIFEKYREITPKEEKTKILTSGKKYKDLSEPEQDLFKDEDTYKKSAEQVIKAKTTLVANSFGIIDPETGKQVQVYDVTAWGKLTPEQKLYFGKDESESKTNYAIAQAQAKSTAQLSDNEVTYLTARDAYLSEDAKLTELQANRKKEKDPEAAKLIDAQIKEQNALVTTAYNNYAKAQPAALGDAYDKQIKAYDEKIQSLQGQADGMAPGDERNKIESQIANYKSAAQIAAIKAKEATGSYTFIERLQSLVTGYNEFSGLAQWSSLFIDDKDLAKRRQEAEDLFCDTILISGTECWKSKICESSIDATIGGTGIVAKTVYGEPRAAVRIQAEMTPPPEAYNATSGAAMGQALYHISYYIHNANEETLTYNLVFHSTDGTRYRAYTKDKELVAGASESRIRTSAIAKYSAKYYDIVCLQMNPGITRLAGGEVKEVCTDIVVYTGGATTTPSAVQTPSQQAGTTSGGTGSGTTGAARQDFEGF